MNYKFLFLLLFPYLTQSYTLAQWSSENPIRAVKKLKYSDAKKEFKTSYYIVLGDRYCKLTDIDGIKELDIVLPDKSITKIANIPKLSINLIYTNYQNKPLENETGLEELKKIYIGNKQLFNLPIELNQLDNLHHVYINDIPVTNFYQTILKLLPIKDIIDKKNNLDQILIDLSLNLSQKII